MSRPESPCTLQSLHLSNSLSFNVIWVLMSKMGVLHRIWAIFCLWGVLNLDIFNCVRSPCVFLVSLIRLFCRNCSALRPNYSLAYARAVRSRAARTYVHAWPAVHFERHILLILLLRAAWDWGDEGIGIQLSRWFGWWPWGSVEEQQVKRSEVQVLNPPPPLTLLHFWCVPDTHWLHCHKNGRRSSASIIRR